MNFDFEEYLRRQSIRPVPAHWRGEILRAARAQPAAPPWWREWLWPSPRAWAGLAAAWGLILLLTVTAPNEPAAAGQCRDIGAAGLRHAATGDGNHRPTVPLRGKPPRPAAPARRAATAQQPAPETIRWLNRSSYGNSRPQTVPSQDSFSAAHCSFWPR